jgi:REP element-mobilizing transposase RayT
MFSPEVAGRVSRFLSDYARENGICMKTNFVNADHVHVLIDLPTGMPIEQTTKLFKGASSHWINEQNLVVGRFGWGRGYGCFSVSQSDVDRVCAYIAGQAEHHRVKTFAEEYERFVKAYGLAWQEDQTVETVAPVSRQHDPSLKRGVNQIPQRPT